MVGNFSGVVAVRDSLSYSLKEKSGLFLVDSSDGINEGFSFSSVRGGVVFNLFDRSYFRPNIRELSLEVVVDFPVSLSRANYVSFVPSIRAPSIFRGGVFNNIEFSEQFRDGSSFFRYFLSVDDGVSVDAVSEGLVDFIDYNFKFVKLHKSLFGKNKNVSCLKKGSLVDGSNVVVGSLEDDLTRVHTVPVFDGSVRSVCLFADYVCDDRVPVILKNYFFPTGRLNGAFKDGVGSDVYVGGSQPLVLPQSLKVPVLDGGFHRRVFLLGFASGDIYKKEFDFVLKSAREYVKNFVDLHRGVVYSVLKI